MSNLKVYSLCLGKFKMLSTTLPLLSAPLHPRSANVRKLILTFQVFRKAGSSEDNRCRVPGLNVPGGRERVNGPCVTVCICYIFYSPLFKLILGGTASPHPAEFQGSPLLRPACLRGSPSPSFDSFSWRKKKKMQRLARFLGTKVSKSERRRSFRAT